MVGSGLELRWSGLSPVVTYLVSLGSHFIPMDVGFLLCKASEVDSLTS